MIVDLRPDSDTYLQWFGAELSQDNYRAMYVPRNFAHAYLTLTPDATTIYQVSTPYTPGAERGLRWNDPALDVAWPHSVDHVSDKDASWPLLSTTPTSVGRHRGGGPLMLILDTALAKRAAETDRSGSAWSVPGSWAAAWSTRS